MRSLPIPGPRMIDEAECICSVLLAIVLSHAIGAENVGWAAFSGYMVMRSHVAESFTRGILRVIGTLAGAGLALAAAPLLLRQPVSAESRSSDRRQHHPLFRYRRPPRLCLAVHRPHFPDGADRRHGTCAGADPALCLHARARSAGRYHRLRHRQCDLDLDSAARATEIRTTICAPSRSTSRRGNGTPRWRVTPLVGGIALALIPWAWLWLGIPSLSQSSITIFAVMLVPAASLAEGMLSPVSSRMMNRLVGCLAGGLLASAIPAGQPPFARRDDHRTRARRHDRPSHRKWPALHELCGPAIHFGLPRGAGA